jgi:hypothetical protein
MNDPPCKCMKFRQHRFGRHGTGHQLLKDWTQNTDVDTVFNGFQTTLLSQSRVAHPACLEADL